MLTFSRKTPFRFVVWPTLLTTTLCLTGCFGSGGYGDNPPTGPNGSSFKYDMSFQPNPVNLAPGTSGMTTATLALNGFINSQGIKIVSITGLPAGVTFKVSQNPIPSGSSTTVITFTADQSTQSFGNNIVTVNAVSLDPSATARNFPLTISIV